VITIIRERSTFPDDGDHTEKCWSCFNENFNTLLKLFSCATFGNKKTLIIAGWGTAVAEGRWFDPSWCHWNFSFT